VSWSEWSPTKSPGSAMPYHDLKDFFKRIASFQAARLHTINNYRWNGFSAQVPRLGPALRWSSRLGIEHRPSLRISCRNEATANLLERTGGSHIRTAGSGAGSSSTGSWIPSSFGRALHRQSLRSYITRLIVKTEGRTKRRAGWAVQSGTVDCELRGPNTQRKLLPTRMGNEK